MNMQRLAGRFWPKILAMFTAGIVALGLQAGAAFAQLPFANFDTSGDTDGFTQAVAPDFPDTVWLEHNQVTGTGNTSGPGALRVEVLDNGGSGGWAVRLDALSSDADLTAYNAFSQVALDESQWFLEFDTTILANEWTDPNLIDPGAIFQLNVGVNSELGDFAQKGDALGNLNFSTGKFSARIPMTSLPLAEGSSSYQLSLGSTADFIAGVGPTEGIDLYFDNFRFTPAPETVEHTLFSWETPDDPLTATVDERYEGWDDTGLNSPGDLNTTVHSIVGPDHPGATNGNYALQIDRVDPADASTFHWGSNFTLSGDTPANQERIDDLVDLINRASAFAFDVRFDDPDPNSPTYTRFAVYVSDNDENFYDAEGDTIGSTAIGASGTYIVPTNIMRNNLNVPLSEGGLAEGTDFLGIGIASNTDGPGLYQIDNFRVIIEVSATVEGDFDQDGDVDGRDFLMWQRGEVSPGNPPSAADLQAWQENFGHPQNGGLQTIIDVNEFLNGGVVPEPSSILLIAWGLGGCVLWRR